MSTFDKGDIVVLGKAIEGLTVDGRYLVMDVDLETNMILIDEGYWINADYFELDFKQPNFLPNQ